jgi:type IV secretion system protein VirD4
MRAMQNYAGHRLAPWLGHLMISRSETARPLLTAGEVMQLPPDDEVVMVAGIPPIRARKARYYEDARFKQRLLPVPKDPRASLAPKPDDWSALKPVPAPAGKSAVGPWPVPVTNSKAKPDDDPANGGVRREPGLERHKDIAPEPVKAPVNEFDPDADKPQRDAATNRTTVREMGLMARRIAMDRGDGMEL